MTQRRAGLAIAALLATASSVALADGDARSGFWLVRHWCGSCHGLGTGVASDGAPALETIARRPNPEGWLKAWLADPHPPMPNFNLSRSEIDDIIAYLNVLATR
ncbi:c-type cytochrome [Dongia sp.]|uniref:c-type cytochrome n=1 Tax=Dongia sp. TaxID=1977262 RepID=UPI0037504FFF